jgi:hypothetical protein
VSPQKMLTRKHKRVLIIGALAAVAAEVLNGIGAVHTPLPWSVFIDCGEVVWMTAGLCFAFWLLKSLDARERKPGE